MRHRVAHRKLGRVTEHRIALLRNQAAALIRHERINTTVAKAKELRPFVERLITVAKRGIAEGAETDVRCMPAGSSRVTWLTARWPRKLFESIAPRFVTRPGGYTRLLRVGYRRGDDAEVAQVELVGSEYSPDSDAAQTPEADAAGASKGIGGRIRRAARRIRGGGDSEAADAAVDDAPLQDRHRKAVSQEEVLGRLTGSLAPDALFFVRHRLTSLGLRIGNDLRVQMGRHFLVVRELHVI